MMPASREVQRAWEEAKKSAVTRTDESDEPDDNYMHHCGETAYIPDGHKRKEPNWCNNCGRTASFTRMEGK